MYVLGTAVINGLAKDYESAIGDIPIRDRGV